MTEGGEGSDEWSGWGRTEGRGAQDHTCDGEFTLPVMRKLSPCMEGKESCDGKLVGKRSVSGSYWQKGRG